MHRQSFSVFFVISFLAIKILQWTKVFANAGIDGWVVLSANVIIYFATAFSFWFSERSLRSPNPNASVRSLYGSFMIKFFVIIMAALIYIMVEKKNVNKPALFVSMGLYLVYTILEVSSLQKLLKQKKDA
ncbi:MAG: hypothetical protein ABIT05_02615 [Chitinophagaceae bacterium]